jgi:ubiquinone/menaquinone biosynthesis C-methylase UbiE
VVDRRDVDAFDQRAARYDEGWLGRFHHEIAERVVSLALAGDLSPRRVLDVGCGTGYQLRLMAQRCAEAEVLEGVDAAPAMVQRAGTAPDERISVHVGVAEDLPFADGTFDLVTSTTSFDHWVDQALGVRECARVLTKGGHLVVADLFSLLLVPTLVGARRSKARTVARATGLLAGAGFEVLAWHDIYPLIKAVIAAPAGRNYEEAPRPTGQLTPVPPRPQ